MLGYGFAFSLVWAGGVGSFIALLTGLRTRKLIKQSKEEISGIVMAWWCIIVGAFGLVVMLPVVVRLLLTAKR